MKVPIPHESISTALETITVLISLFALLQSEIFKLLNIYAKIVTIIFMIYNPQQPAINDNRKRNNGIKK